MYIFWSQASANKNKTDFAVDFGSFNNIKGENEIKVKTEIKNNFNLKEVYNVLTIYPDGSSEVTLEFKKQQKPPFKANALKGGNGI